jgi:pilus assembly protein Flp/PilA
MHECWRRFLAEEGGATAVEYGMICGSIFMAVVGAIVTLGAQTGNMFENI